jgi:uncharacterized membrane protein
MLLLIQVLVLAGGAIFVYLLAEGVLENKPISLAFACCYLLNPAMQRAVLYDFHAVTLATTFLFGAYYFIYKQRYVMFVLFAILAGITKEEIWVIVALLGLYIAIAEFFKNNITGKQKKRSAKVVVFGLGVFGVSLAIFFDLLWYAIPQAANGQHFALQYFSDGSDSPSSLVKNIILSPGKTIQKVLQQERLDYFRKLLEPIGYLSLFSPLFLIFPGADLALNILSDKGELHQIYYQYTAAITPFLFIAAIYGVKNIRRFRPALPMAVLIGYISVMSIMGAYLFGPLPGAAEPNLAMIVQKQADIDYINSALDAISPEYAVASSNALGSHLSQRKYIFTLPNGIDKADVVAFLFSDRYNTPSQAWHKEAAAKLKKDPRYRVWFEKGDFLVFRKIKK